MEKLLGPDIGPEMERVNYGDDKKFADKILLEEMVKYACLSARLLTCVFLVIDYTQADKQTCYILRGCELKIFLHGR